MIIIEYIFWLSVIFVLYTYVGYPLSIWILGRMYKPVLGDPDQFKEWPNVTIIIPVHNEEKNISNKLDNLKLLDYPQENIEIIFVSDGSTDETNKLLSDINEIRLLSYFPRKGNPTALNLAVLEAKSDIILFTDVRQEVDSLAVKYLVSTLSKKGIGAVSGELVHRDSLTNTGKNVGLYWRYEKWIRKAESRFHSTAGVTGALYIIHRNDYAPLPEDTLLDDFEVPIQILKSKKRVVFDTRAKIYDDAQDENKAEQKRKLRTLTGNYQSFMRHLWLFSPYSNPVFVQFISHKVFRLLVPYALILILITSLLLSGRFYELVVYLQFIFYGLGLAALIWPDLKTNRFINFIVVFIGMNWVALLALIMFVAQKVDVQWEKT